MESEAERGEFQSQIPLVEFTSSQKSKQLAGLLGGAPPADRRYYRDDVGGQPVYYDSGPPPAGRAGRPSTIRPGNVYAEDSTDSFAYMSEFTNTKVRHAFVKKVYSILFMQLGFTALVILLFVVEPTCNKFCRDYPYVPLIFLGVSLIFYLVLVCCQSCRINYPQNIILLGIYTVLSAIGFGGIAALYAPLLVLYSFSITAGVTLLITLLAMQSWVDITGCGMYLCIIGMVVSIFGLICMIVMLVMGWNDTTRILYLVYASIAALVACLYFMFMTQLILGGKKYELSPEEYVLGAIILYTEFMQLFLLILSIFGAANN